jgi:hypothetical protein
VSPSRPSINHISKDVVNMGDRTRGLYEKFRVERTDGESAPGGKHEGCEYFVLDLTHDPHALPAILAYAKSCESEYPMLASDPLIKAGGGDAPA